MNQEQEKRFSLRTSLLWGTVALAVSSYFVFDVWAMCCPAGTTGLVSCDQGWCCDTATTMNTTTGMTTGMTTEMTTSISSPNYSTTCDGNRFVYYRTLPGGGVTSWTDGYHNELCGETPSSSATSPNSSVYTSLGRSSCDQGRLRRLEYAYNGETYWSDAGPCTETDTTGMTTDVSMPYSGSGYSSNDTRPVDTRRVYTTCMGDVLVYVKDNYYRSNSLVAPYTYWTDEESQRQNWRCGGSSPRDESTSYTGNTTGMTTEISTEAPHSYSATYACNGQGQVVFYANGRSWLDSSQDWRCRTSGSVVPTRLTNTTGMSTGMTTGMITGMTTGLSTTSSPKYMVDCSTSKSFDTLEEACRFATRNDGTCMISHGNGKVMMKRTAESYESCLLRGTLQL